MRSIVEAIEARRQARVGLLDRGGEREEDVLGDAVEGTGGVGVGLVPGVMDVQRRPVVDQPGPPIADDQVGVARRAVRIDGQIVEPHDVRGPFGALGRRTRHVAGQRAGHEGKADVEPDRPAEQIADLVVRLRPGDLLRQRREHDLGHRQAERSTDLPHHELRDQRLLAVAGAAELDDVLAPVIGLDQRRQRASLAERRDVSGDVDACAACARVYVARRRTVLPARDPAASGLARHRHRRRLTLGGHDAQGGNDGDGKDAESDPAGRDRKRGRNGEVGPAAMTAAEMTAAARIGESSCEVGAQARPGARIVRIACGRLRHSSDGRAGFRRDGPRSQ